MKKVMKKVIVAMASTAMLPPLAAYGNSDTDSIAAITAATAITVGDSEASEGGGSVDADGVDHTQGEPFKIRFATNASAGGVVGDGISQTEKGIIYFCKQVKERSGGRTTTRILTDGQLASSTRGYIGGAQNGAYEVFMLSCGSWTDYTPAYAGLNIPYFYMNYDDAYVVLDSGLRQEWNQRVQADIQCIPLAHLDIGFRQLTAGKEIHSPADLKGVKICAMVDPIQMNCRETLGANVAPVPYAELCTALQQKLVDAQENPPSNIVSSKIYEMQSYCTKTNHNFATTIMAASPVSWSMLLEEDKIFIQDPRKEIEIYVRSLTEDLPDGFFDEMQSKGATVIELATDELKVFQDVTKSVWPQVEEQMDPEAYNKPVGLMPDYQAKE